MPKAKAYSVVLDPYAGRMKNYRECLAEWQKERRRGDWCGSRPTVEDFFDYGEKEDKGMQIVRLHESPRPYQVRLCGRVLCQYRSVRECEYFWSDWKCLKEEEEEEVSLKHRGISYSEEEYNMTTEQRYYIQNRQKILKQAALRYKKNRVKILKLGQAKRDALKKPQRQLTSRASR